MYQLRFNNLWAWSLWLAWFPNVVSHWLNPEWSLLTYLMSRIVFLPGQLTRYIHISSRIAGSILYNILGLGQLTRVDSDTAEESHSFLLAEVYTYSGVPNSRTNRNKWTLDKICIVTNKRTLGTSFSLRKYWPLATPEYLAVTVSLSTPGKSTFLSI